MYIYIHIMSPYSQLRHLVIFSPLPDQAMKQLTDAQCSTYSGDGHQMGRWVKFLI